MKSKIILIIVCGLSSLAIFAQNSQLLDKRIGNSTNILVSDNASNRFNYPGVTNGPAGNGSTNGFNSRSITNGFGSDGMTNGFSDRAFTNHGIGKGRAYTNNGDTYGIYTDSPPSGYTNPHSNYKNPYPIDPKVIGGAESNTNR